MLYGLPSDALNAMDGPTDRTDYLLAGGAAELERLQLQARVWEPEAEILLERIGVRAGWSCLDLGCGALGILGPLARRVGPSGRVLGVDLDRKQLQAAREYLQRADLGHASVEERDAFRTGLPPDSFDLVHARFLAAPTGRSDELVEEMTRLARPGGIVALQEPDTSSWHCYPPNADFGRLTGLVEAAFARGGGQLSAGRDLFQRLRDHGLEAVKVRAAVVALQDRHPYMRLPSQFAASLRSRIVGTGLMTDEELDDAIATVDRITADPATFVVSFVVLQAWGRKTVVST